VSDALGNSYVTESICLNFLQMCPDAESLTLKYDADGHLQWKAWLSGPIHQAGSIGAGLDAAGNVYVLSVVWLHQDSINGLSDPEFAIAKYAPNGSRLWIRFIHSTTRSDLAAKLAVSPQGNVYVTGTTAAPMRNPDEVLTVKVDTNGNLLWSRT